MRGRGSRVPRARRLIPRSTDVVVVGAGHNGLTAAAVLAHAGLDVVVVEARADAGGAASTEELVAGYRFSSCAYALHLLHETVVDAIGLVRLLPPIRTLPPRVCVLPDGAVTREDDVDAAERAAWHAGWDAAARLLDPFLVGPPPCETALVARDGATHDRLSTSTLGDLLDAAFTSAEGRAIYAPRLVDTPFDVPGAPLAYAYVETSRLRLPAYRGVPEGGMGAVADAFRRAAEKGGARVVLGTPVVAVRRGEVTLADGSTLRGRAVVSGAPPQRTLALVDPDLVPARDRAAFGRVESGPPAAKLYCALRGEPDLRRLGVDGPDLGLVHVYPVLDWYGHAFGDAAGNRIPRSYVELQLPTVHDRSLAPPGGHCLAVYLPYAPRGVPAGPLTDHLLRLAARAIPNLREILVETVLRAPADLADRIGLAGGAIHHVAHAPGQMLDSRPLPGWADGRTPVQGLYLCGAGIHPGGEVSGMPGLNAARTVLADLG